MERREMHSSGRGKSFLNTGKELLACNSLFLPPFSTFEEIIKPFSRRQSVGICIQLKARDSSLVLKNHLIFFLLFEQKDPARILARQRARRMQLLPGGDSPIIY